MNNVVKWLNILQKSYGVNTARLLKYVWLFYNIMHERVNALLLFCFISSKLHCYFIFDICMYTGTYIKLAARQLVPIRLGSFI